MNEFQIKKILRQGDISRKQGKFSQALILYNKAIPFLQIQNDNKITNQTSFILKKEQIEKVFINKISCLIATFRYDEALKQSEKLIVFNPRNFKAYYQKANILFLQKNYQDAISQYSTAIRLSEESQYSTALLALYTFNRGLSYQKLKKNKLCIQDYQDAIRLDQNNEDYYVALASIYQEDSKIKQAYKVLQNISKLNHQCYKVHKLYGKLLKSQGKYEQSLKHLNKSISILNNIEVLNKKQELNDLITSKIYLLKLMSKNQQVLKCYDLLIQSNPQDSYYMNNKAVYLDMLDRHQEAIKIYDNILISNPKYVEAHINKGNTLIRLKQYNLALFQFNQAIHKKQIKKQPVSPLYYCHRALANQKLHKFQQCLQDLQKAYECLQRQKQQNQVDNFGTLMSSQNQKFVRKILLNFSKMIKKIQQLQQNVNTTCSKQYRQRDSYDINQNSRQLQKNKVKRFRKDFIQSLLQSIHSKKQFQILKFQNQYQILKDQIDILNQKNLKMQATILTLHKTKSDFNILKGNICQQNQKIQLLSQRVNEIQKIQEEILIKFNLQFKKIENQHDKLRNKINELKNEQDKQNIVKYAQEMFWLLNAYFISFRILKTKLVKKDKPAQKSKIAKVLSLSKDAMSIFKSAPVIGKGFQIIQKILEIYLQAESSYINQILYQFTIINFLGQSQINQFILNGICLLIQKQYIQNRIKLYNQEDTNLRTKSIEMSMSNNNNGNKMEINLNKAKRWFQQKKKSLIQKVSKIEQFSTKNDLISLIVKEDIAQLFCYIIKIMPSQSKSNKQNKNKSKNKQNPFSTQQAILIPTKNIFQKVFINHALDQTLLQLYKQNYQKQQANDMKDGSRCKVCTIY